MKQAIMSLSDYNQIPEGSELHYKSGGYGWWLGDEEIHSRGGRQVNGSLMNWLLKLGVGMANRQSVASHQCRFFVETRRVDESLLLETISLLEEIWRDLDIRREYELRRAFDEIQDFRLTEWSRPRCYWAMGDGWEEKAFRFRGYRWVYGRARYLSDMPRQLGRLRLCIGGRDLAAESRAQMVEAA